MQLIIRVINITERLLSVSLVLCENGRSFEQTLQPRRPLAEYVPLRAGF